PCRPDTCSFGSASSTQYVATTYMTVMNAPAVRSARGTVRRASLISSPIVDALSAPANAKAIVDQKITSLTLIFGTSASNVIGVADPKRFHDSTPRAISANVGIQSATAPALVNHLPMFTPITFITTAIV